MAKTDQPIYQKMTNPNTHTHTHETYHPIRLGPPFDPNRPEWVSFVTVGPLLPLVVAMTMMIVASWVVVVADGDFCGKAVEVFRVMGRGLSQPAATSISNAGFRMPKGG